MESNWRRMRWEFGLPFEFYVGGRFLANPNWYVYPLDWHGAALWYARWNPANQRLILDFFGYVPGWATTTEYMELIVGPD